MKHGAGTGRHPAEHEASLSWHEPDGETRRASWLAASFDSEKGQIAGNLITWTTDTDQL